MKRFDRLYIHLFAVLLVVVCFIGTGVSCHHDRPPPKLIVFLILDGFRADYFDRFRDILGPGGLVTLFEEGTTFTNARVDHFFSATGPGHAAIATGCYPRRSGIISNVWFDRELGEETECVQDEKTRLLGAGDRTLPGASPQCLWGPHITDVFKSNFGDQAKVFSVSGKDRSAVIMGGRDADGVFWFSDELGAFTTSTWYYGRLPGWVNRFNRVMNLSKLGGGSWDLLLPIEGREKCREDECEFESDRASLGVVFPHPLGKVDDTSPSELYKALTYTPLIDSYTIEFVLRLIEEEELGFDEIPDLLLVSLSGPDNVGHNYGPFSLEMGDVIWRVDRLVSRLLETLSRRMDLKKECLVILSSDHGMAPLPEISSEMGEEAGRVITNGTAETWDERAIGTIVDNALDLSFGEADWVLSDAIPCIYLNRDAADLSGTPFETVMETARSTLLGIKGIKRVVTSRGITMGVPSEKDILGTLRKWYLPERCGELVLELKPYFVFTSVKSAQAGGTNHGSMHDYDTRIPLVFYGWRIGSVTREDAAHQVDILPSLIHMLQIGTDKTFDGSSLF